MRTLEAPERYKTAEALISCAHFKKGEFVSVRFYHHGDNGEAWFLIERTQEGPLPYAVVYPESHLTSFCL